MTLTKKQLNLVTNWAGGLVAGVGILGDIPLAAVVEYVYNLNPQVMALLFGVYTLFFATGKDVKD